MYLCHGKPSVEIKLGPFQGQSITDVSLQKMCVVPVQCTCETHILSALVQISLESLPKLQVHKWEFLCSKDI